MSLQLSCDDSKSALDLLKLALRNSDCQEWINCDNKDISLDAIAKLLIQQGADGSFAVNVCGCGGSTPGPAGLISVTYAELVALIGSSGLTAGAFYLLTDFATKHYFTDDDTTLNDINTGATEPLILFATSVNNIDSRVYSPSYPQDVIHYDWNAANWLTDISFAKTGVIVTGWKGIITYREDTFQDVSCGYDFRNVKFRRWQCNKGSGEFDDLYIGWNSVECNGLSMDAAAHVDVYTFSNFYSHVRSVHIGINQDNDYSGDYMTRLNNIVFSIGADLGWNLFLGTNINDNCYWGTFIDEGYHITLGVYNKQFIFNSIAEDVTIGSHCYEITIGENVVDVVMGTHVHTVYITDNCGYIRIGSYSNTITMVANYAIELHDENSAITLAEDCEEITIGMDSHSITFGARCAYINMEEHTNNVVLGTDCLYLKFMSHCTDLTFGNSAQYDVFEPNFNTVDFTAGSPTHVYAAYSCTFFKRQDGTARLTYVNNSDVQQIVAATA